MKHRCALIVVLLMALVVQTQSAPLVNRGAPNWRWRAGITEASAPANAWRVSGFDDSQFVTAPAPFWFGDALPGGTEIMGMLNVYTSLFLRVTFNITNTSEVAYLRMGALVDDGFVAWINGTEVLRVNMVGAAGSAVSITTLANNAAEPPPFDIVTLLNPSYLVVGSNVLAVQVFQSSGTSSDLGFDASLESVLVETTPPTVASASPSANSTVIGLSAITVTFSEPVTGVDASDFLINGVAASSVTPVSSTVYVFGFPQPAYGTVQISWDSNHGIADQAIPPNSFNAAGAAWQYSLVDQTPPVVATISPAGGATVRALTNISVLFTEDVTGVDAADLRINTQAAANVTGAGNAYTFTFTQPETGIVQVAWAASHGIVDTAANPFAGGNWLYTLDPNAGQLAGPIITEFMALNINGTGALLDEEGESSDWIEIQNTGATTVNLFDWALTDDADDLNKWQFPATNLAAGGFIVVFASEKDRRVPGARLHTNFKLEGTGEYLALVRPDGSIASEFAPMYPQQASAVSFGLGVLSTNSTLVSTTAPVRVRIPTSSADGTNWLYVGFDDASWMAGTNGVGFGSTNITQADYSAAILPTGPLLYWRFSETSGATAANLGSLGAAANGGYQSSPILAAAGPRPTAFNGFETDNRAVQLNGTANGDYVSGPSGLLNGRTAFSMAGWIRPTAAQAARTGLFGQNDAVEFGFISAGTLHAWTPSGNIASYTYPYPNDEWHHVALVGANSQLLLYVDGTQRANAAFTAAGSSANGFNAGGGGVFDATGNDFAGQIDEVAMWDRSLSAAEVLSLYRAGTNPVGVAAIRFVKTDVGPVMSNINATAYLRLPFTIDSAANVQTLSLRVRHDDGFVAFLNGIEVARANAPQTLAFNSTATGTHTAATADLYTFGPATLRHGANVLAIHGLNASVADEDFLITAELTATHVAAASSGGVYMTGPTPGSANGAGVTLLGPIISDEAHSPSAPLDSQNLVVTARVTPTFAAVASVVVRYRVMFNAENELPMFDDGMHGDGFAGDGIYGQTLPIAALSTNGQMVRWYFRATDGLNKIGRWPLFLAATDTEYFGTVVEPTYVTSQLPIFHLFAAANVLDPDPPTSQVGADSEAGGRISIYYDGEFYDNVYMELRGNTSAGQQKKSHRLEFNRDHEFRHLPGYPRLRKTSLMAEYLDPAYIRQHLCFWLLEKMGVPAPFFYPVRAQLNGQFYALVFHNDVIGQGQVERMGYDPKGALYKAAGNVLISRSSTGVFQKLEPDGPPDYTDYNQLCNGIVETASLANRRIAVFDMMDVPEVINYLAGARWCAENDDVWANMSIYRDTFGDQLWRIIPFDMNASWGQRYGGITPLDAIADSCKSHPLYGGATTIACDGSTYNRIYDVIIAVPETRQMLLRRQRTVLDRWVMEPGVPSPSRQLETHIRYMTNLIWTEAFLDRAKWGYSTWTASNKPLTNAITELFNEFINLRRIHFSATHSITNSAKPIGINKTDNAGIPLSQPAQASLAITAIEFNPSSGNQLQEYITVTNPNPFALDISGWKLASGVNFTFHPGTIVPSNSVVHVSPSIPAFRTRTTGPRGGQGLFVVGPYKGQLSARGEALTLHDDRGRLVYSNSYPGSPSLAQQHLRITEIMYNPAPLAGNTNDAQEFEYLELKNTSADVTLDLNGVRLINGVDFNFAGSAITSLGPGERALVVRNATAFQARYGGGRPVAGQYAGALDNAGERLQLVDTYGEEILDFSYNNSWYPVTDGQGFSLVVRGEMAEPDAWGSRTNWYPSGTLYGAPGLPDTTPPSFAPILITEVLSHTDSPLRDAVELWNPTATNVDIGGWFLSDDFATARKYRFPNPTMIAGGGYLTVDETVLTNVATALIPFAFSGAGDEAWIFSGDANTNLTGYAYGVDFGAAATGVSFGRHTNSVGQVHFVAQAANSLGNPNSAPRVGPVVIAEIMYRPPDLPGGVDNSIDEYIELRNITGDPVPLYNTNRPVDTWHLRGGVDFDFPPGVTLPGASSLLLVNFSPSDTLVAAAFRTKYGLSESLPLYGPYSGNLANDNDNVELKRPDDPVLGDVPYILLDKVEYEDSGFWPAAADGSGSSLQRISLSSYGNDPASWAGAAPSAGGNYAGGVVPVITVQPVDQTALASQPAMLSVMASGTSPLRYQWRQDGAIIPGATNAILTLENLQLSQAGTYSVVVFNGAGATLSSNATLTINIPAFIFTQPAAVTLRGSTNVLDYGFTTNNATFNVFAVGTGPVSYQWRFNSNLIAGATGASLTVSNVGLAHEGIYDVLVTDASGTIPSAPARLTVLVIPVFVLQPLAQTVPAGSVVTLSAEVTGNPLPMSFEWRRGSTALATNTVNRRLDFFSFTSTNVPQTIQYRVVVKNAANPAPGLASALVNIVTVADTDFDGIPDTVESGLGLDPNNANDADSDLDGDGMSNRDEYVAGTEINNMNSYLRIDQNTVPGMAILQFAAVSNRTYSVQYSGHVPNAGSWNKLGDFGARSTNRVEIITDPGWSSNRFYRVIIPSQ